jgi:hypothetical protein
MIFVAYSNGLFSTGNKTQDTRIQGSALKRVVDGMNGVVLAP